MYHLKIKLSHIGTQEARKLSRDTVSSLKADAWRAANIIADSHFIHDTAWRRSRAPDEQPEEHVREQFVALFGARNPMTHGYRIVRATLPRLPSAVVQQIGRDVSQAYARHRSAMITGYTRLTRYRPGMPVPWAPQGVRFMHDDKGAPIVRFTLARGHHWCMRIVFGRDGIGHRARIEQMIAGELRYGRCLLQTPQGTNKSAFLTVPVHQTIDQIAVDPTRIMAAHVGYESILTIAFSGESEVRHIGYRRDLVEHKRQFADRRRRARAAMPHVKSGHGYRRRLKALSTINHAEARWLRSYYHDITAKANRAARWRGVGTVLLEDIAPESPETVLTGIVRHFSELQAQLTHKARSYGASVLYVTEPDARNDVAAARAMLENDIVFTVLPE